MPATNIEIAKNIFIKYGGSHFHMHREGEYEFYKSFNISKEQEKLWIKEYQKELFVKIEIERDANTLITYLSNLSSSICNYKDIDNLKLMLDIVQKKSTEVDSFSQVIMAEEVLNIVETFDENNSVMINAKQLALEILKNVVVNPITVGASYKKLGYLNDALNEDSILTRAKRFIHKYD